MDKYLNLLSNGKIGPITTKNRVVMPPMGTQLASVNGEISDHMIQYYEERAAGGTGLIIMEVVCIEGELGKAIPNQLRIDDDKFISGLSRIAAAVQKYDTRIFAQLHHAGNQSNSKLTGGKQIVAPSAVTNAAVGEEPRELSTSEVKDLVEKFIQGALRAQTAGFDGVELHGAHGYLIGEFLSIHTNRRSDEYGGNFENRTRFVTQIIKGIKSRCGKEFPVIVRFSADEFTGKGISQDESKLIAQALENAGADALDVSAGTYESLQTAIEPITFQEGWKVYLAEEIKSFVNIPVIAVGAIKRPAKAEEILQQGRADFIAIGRGLLSDAEWVNKAAQGRSNEIFTCIGCMYCTDTIFSGKRILCAVNARTGRELEFPGFPKNGQNRTVSIVGGGPAGMEAARVLSMRGFRPVLYEKQSQLGGELIPGCTPPDKEPIKWYKDSLIENLKNTETVIKMDTEATVDLVKEDKPYAVILATGGKSKIPPNTPDPDNKRIFTAIDILNNPDLIHPEDSTIVIGGGSTGCETAELLEYRGTHVTLVEMQPEIFTGENNLSKAVMIDRLINNPKIDILTNHKLVAVHDGQIELTHTTEQGSKKLPADKIIIAIGLSANQEETEIWKNSFERVTVVGDALRPSNVAFAVRTAFDTAYTLR
ncbi:NADH:flavin oxidoreductase [Chitinispirillum alkaliphilum]|nr:NADH:flavin oxidoreductase [Chitinispirillum alkaliphilum]